MEKSKIFGYYSSLNDSFLNYFHKTAESQEMEAIHQLRVSIKKQRALLKLFEIISKGSFRKDAHYTLFSKLFKKAGNVRELQVNLLLLQKFSSKKLIPFKDHLQKNQKTEIKKLMKQIKKFDFDQLDILNAEMLEKTKKTSEKLVVQKSLKLIHSKLKKVNTLKAQYENEKILHKIRIYLKACSELLSYLKSIMDEKAINTLYDQVKKNNKMIGNWHDNIILLASMDKFEKESENNKLTKEISKKIIQQNEKLKEKIKWKLIHLPKSISLK